MPENEHGPTAEQKLLHAIYVPSPDTNWMEYMTDDVLAQLHKRIEAAPPFRSRLEACGEIRACFDRFWQLLIWDVHPHSDPHDARDDDVVVDLAFDLAAIVCRLLVDLDFPFTAAESSPDLNEGRPLRGQPAEQRDSPRISGNSA